MNLVLNVVPTAAPTLAPLLAPHPAPLFAPPLASPLASPLSLFPAPPGRPAPDTRDGAGLLRRLRTAPAPRAAARFDHWLTRLQAAWYAGDQALAVAAVDAAGALIGPLTPAGDQQLYHVFSALALARGGDPAALPAVLRHCDALRGLDQGCRAGGGALPALAQAAYERRRGDAVEALRGFEQAAEAAARHGLHWAATLACEQAALHADDCALASVAHHYRQRALDACRRWGAVKHLEALRAAWGEYGATAAQPLAAPAGRPGTDGLAGLAPAIAHELNQPLAAVALHAAAAAKWLRRAQPDLERALDSLALIGAAGRQAGDIVRGMQRLAAGQAIETAGVDVDAALRDTLQLLRPPLRRHGIELELALGLDGCRIDANRAQLQQVATNLVMNAIEAHAAGPAGSRRIRIASRRCGLHHVELEVSDNGPGVAPHERERLFSGRSSTKRGRAGAGAATHAGLGLSISSSIVRAHGGRLWFEPCLPHGAAFRLRLPLQAGQKPA